MGMLFYFVNDLYTAEALLMHVSIFDLHSNVIQDSLKSGKWGIVSLITTWIAVNSVKLSFLSLFRKLVDRIRPMIIYWWFVLAYTIVVGLYGISTYLGPCPTFNDIKSCKCTRAT